MALRGCNLRFRQRFHEMEQASPRPLEQLPPAELEALWADAKRKLAAINPPANLEVQPPGTRP
jgi:XTP/dITP diphosphohydrolase/ATP diphosphatase